MRLKTEWPEYFLWNNAKMRAKKKNIEFSIRISDIKIPKECPILKIPLRVGPGKICPNSPSLDRIDTSKGYVRGDISVISFKANANKCDMTIEEIERILKYMKGELIANF